MFLYFIFQLIKSVFISIKVFIISIHDISIPSIFLSVSFLTVCSCFIILTHSVPWRFIMIPAHVTVAQTLLCLLLAFCITFFSWLVPGTLAFSPLSSLPLETAATFMVALVLDCAISMSSPPFQVSEFTTPHVLYCALGYLPGCDLQP